MYTLFAVSVWRVIASGVIRLVSSRAILTSCIGSTRCAGSIATIFPSSSLLMPASTSSRSLPFPSLFSGLILFAVYPSDPVVPGTSITFRVQLCPWPLTLFSFAPWVRTALASFDTVVVSFIVKPLWPVFTQLSDVGLDCWRVIVIFSTISWLIARVRTCCGFGFISVSGSIFVSLLSRSVFFITFSLPRFVFSTCQPRLMPVGPFPQWSLLVSRQVAWLFPSTHTMLKSFSSFIVFLGHWQVTFGVRFVCSCFSFSSFATV